MSHNNLQQTTPPKSFKDEPEFRLFVGLFKKMIKEKDVEKLKAIDGVQGLANALGVDVNYGLDSSSEGQQPLSFQDREDVFGRNVVKALQRQTPVTWTRVVTILHPFALVLIFAIINTILGLSFEDERRDSGWIDGVGIWVIVLTMFLLGLVSEYQGFQARQVVNTSKEVFDVTVLRDGREQLLKNSELLVGDIQVLTKDVTVAADGLLFVYNDLFINEDVITGESSPIRKRVADDPFCRSGTQVTNGSGRILVIAVGEDSDQAQTLKAVADPTDYEETTQNKAVSFMFRMSMWALCLGFLSFVALLIRWMVSKNGFPFNKISDDGPVHFLILAIVIVVVELPYGIFLLAIFTCVYRTWKLTEDKLFIRTSNAFHQMSDVKSICFDKTGTLTENKMTVVQGWFQETYFDRLPKLEELDPSAVELITENASLNSEAFFNNDNNGCIQFVGNQIECALLVMTEKFGVDFSKVRLNKRPHIIRNYGFNSDKKMSSIIVREGDLLRLYNKGAAEIVLNKCTQYINPLGSRNPISEDSRIELETAIETMASQGLSTLALSYVDLNPNEFNFRETGEPLDESVEGKRGFAEAPEDNLVLLVIVGIKDPIREGVSEVVEQFKKAYINVKMITGDNLETAKQVARECGILTSEGLAMEGREFRRRVEEDVESLKRNLHRFQVMARSRPSDKQKLVELLQSLDEKVAVCGDGTNDALAMKESDIGIALGTNSTEIARKAADVVVLNDNVSSILALYLWSQRVALSLWGYAQFRLSVTLVVWIVVLVSVCVGGETPLNAHQFLWANFIIDTLILSAFATERPPSRVPNDESYTYRKRDPKLDISNAVHILLQSLYQIIVTLCTFYSLSSLFERYNEDEHDLAKMRKNSLMFNIFIFMQLFNALNYRKVFSEYNIFEGFFNSPLSLSIRLVTIGLQLVVMLTPMRTLFKVTELNAWEWLYSIGVSVTVIPLSTFFRYRARKWREHARVPFY